jgi:hypothetical protein
MISQKELFRWWSYEDAYKNHLLALCMFTGIFCSCLLNAQTASNMEISFSRGHAGSAEDIENCGFNTVYIYLVMQVKCDRFGCLLNG